MDQSRSASDKQQNKTLHALLANLAGRIDHLPDEYRADLLPHLRQVEECLLAGPVVGSENNATETIKNFETIFKVDPGGMAVLTLPDLVHRVANAAYRAIIPDPSINPIGRTLYEIWPENEQLALAGDVFTRLAENSKSIHGSHRIYYPGGGVRNFTTHLVPFEWQGQPAVLMVNWETTQIEKMLSEVEQRESQLRQSEARYRQLIETAYEGIWTIDANGVTDFINERGAQILGYTVEEMLGRPALSFHIPDDMENAAKNLESKKQGLSGTNEYRMRHKSGSVVLISSSTSPIMDEQGRFAGALAMFTDITQRRQAEQVLRSLEVQRRLLEHREHERQEIARNLHDGPIQSLVGMLFSLKAAREVTQSPAYTNLLEQITAGIRENVQELREVVNQLRPPALLNYGLSRAIQIHSEDLRSRHPQLKLDLDLIEDENLINEDTCLALYRIYQEGINNIFRHAQASDVSVRYYLLHRQVILQIRDNGIGFEIPPDWVEFTRSNHFGVVGMKERAEALGGTLSIISKPGEGTTLEVRVPLP